MSTDKFFEINGFKVRNSKFYLKDPNGRQVIHTTIRSDAYDSLNNIAKKHKKPMSKILDMIVIKFNEHPEIYREFIRDLKQY